MLISLLSHCAKLSCTIKRKTEYAVMHDTEGGHHHVLWCILYRIIGLPCFLSFNKVSALFQSSHPALYLPKLKSLRFSQPSKMKYVFWGIHLYESMLTRCDDGYDEGELPPATDCCSVCCHHVRSRYWDTFRLLCDHSRPTKSF